MVKLSRYMVWTRSLLRFGLIAITACWGLMLTVHAQYSDIWGTSFKGGNHDAGYVFRMDADGGGFEKVHHFKGGIQGELPNGALTEGPDGRLYGLTAQGGEHNKGIIYSYSPEYDSFTIEYHPSVYLGQKLLLAPDGKFYVNSSQSSGSLYAYDPVARSLDLVYNYSKAEGRDPFGEGNFILVDGHRIIGTTYSGGSMDDGVLFEYDLDTSTWQVLHHFGGAEGRAPSATLGRQGSKLYGTTIWGGDNSRGALFEYDLDSDTLSVKAHFDNESSRAKGAGVGPDGKVYLQSPTGGVNYHGGVLRYDPSSGNLDLIHSFASSGTNIATGSILHTWEGRLFGVTRYGGSGSGLGTVYEINVAAGSVSVRQSFDNGFPTDSRLVEVGERVVTSVAIQAPASAIATDNGTLLLESILLPAESAEQAVVWSVDDPSVATINANGLLTAVGNGTVVVTATANDGAGVDDSISITVSNQDGTPPVIPVERIDLSESRLYLTSFGSTQQLNASSFPTNASNATVNWSSLGTSVATVSTSGLVQAVGAGTTTVTATAADGSDVTTSLEVEVTQLVTLLTITPSTDTLDTMGQTIDFDVVVTPANATNPDVTWSVSSIYVNIDQDGVFSADGNGQYTVTATATDGSDVTATRSITVTNQYVTVQGINIYTTNFRSDISYITADQGTLQMTMVYSPLDSTDPTFTWVSSDTSVATVSSSGLVTAVGNGVTTIRTTSVDGPSDTHAIWVYNQASGPVNVSSVEITPETASIDERGGTLKMVATILPEGASGTGISWTLIGSGASLSGDGLLTGLENGDVQVRAYTQNLYGQTVFSDVATVTLSNQDDPLARIEPEFSIDAGKARISYTRFVPDSGVTIAYEGTPDLSAGWTTLQLDTHYTIHETIDHGDGTETIVLELTGDSPESYFLQILAVEE